MGCAVSLENLHMAQQSSELIVIATTLFVFVACSQSSANEFVGEPNANSTSIVEEETKVQSREIVTEEVNQLPKTTMSFASMVHDFGTIEEGEKVSHSFTFVNTGDEPLVISVPAPTPVALGSIDVRILGRKVSLKLGYFFCPFV